MLGPKVMSITGAGLNLGFAAALASWAVVQGLPAGESAYPQPASGWIAGKLTPADMPKLVFVFRVMETQPGETEDDALRYTHEKGRPLELVACVKDAAGQYRIEAPPGEYMVTCWSRRLLGESKSSILVRPGETTTVDFQLQEGGVITGRIRADPGDRVWVACETFADAPNPRGVGKAAAVDTATGEYRLEGLSPGEYALRVVSEAKGLITPLDLQLPDGKRLSEPERKRLTTTIREIVEGRLMHNPDSLRHYGRDYRNRVPGAEGEELTYEFWQRTLRSPLRAGARRQVVTLARLELLMSASQADRAAAVTRTRLRVADRLGERPAMQSVFDRLWIFARPEGTWKLVREQLLCEHAEAMLPSLRHLAPELTKKTPEWFRYVPAERVPQLHRVRVLAGEESAGHDYDVTSER